MNKVYAVGTMEVIVLDGYNPVQLQIVAQRLWFLFSDFKMAEKAVLFNDYDIFECNFNMALIEEIDVLGLPNSVWETPKQWWYIMDRHINNSFEISAIETPECFIGTCNFWVG